MNADDRPLTEYVTMVRRRWKLAAAAGAAVFLAFAFYAHTTTPVYEAAATIYVERQTLPDATIPVLPDQQLIPVTQRVLSTPNIAQVIEKYNLYSAARATVPIEDLALEFRSNVVVAPSVVSTPTSSSRGPVTTYAYTVTFRYYDPEKVAAVANELAQLHVTENSAMRSGTAARTSAFLQAEADKVAKKIAEVQAKIAALIGQGGGVVASEDPMLAAQRYEQLDRELANVDASLRAARERKAVLEAEALQTPKYRAILADGQTVIRGEDRLLAAQQELVALQARYSDNHPDIVRLKREIAALTGGNVDHGLLASQLRANIAATEQQLTAAREKYSDDHPDVVALQRNLETLKQQLAAEESKSAAPVRQPPPDNPIYLQLQTRIRTAEIEINELTERRSALYSRLMQYSYDPQMDAKYAPLARERALLQDQYEDLRRRYTEATLAESVESEEQGQILTLAERARIPSSPVEPNRPLLLALGFVLALGAAFGSAWTADFLDVTVRGSRDIEALLRRPPLAMIPYIDSPDDVVHRRKMRILAALGALTVAVVAFVVLS